jgi:hypothetical protein
VVFAERWQAPTIATMLFRDRVDAVTNSTAAVAAPILASGSQHREISPLPIPGRLDQDDDEGF